MKLNEKPFKDYLKDEKLYVFDYVERNLNRTVEMFSYANMPKEIPLFAYEKSLQRAGWLSVFRFEEKMYAMPCSLYGEPDPYLMPKKVIVVNPYLNIDKGGFEKVMEVGKDCELVRNDTSCIGLLPMLTKYALMARTAELTLDTLTFLSRIPFLITAKNLNQKEGAQAFLEKVKNGDYGVIAGNEFFDSVKTDITPKGERQIADVVEMANYVQSRLFNEIGILADYNGMKKERTGGADTQFATPSLIPLVENMLNERKQGWERVNALFGTEVEVDFNSVWQLNMAFLNDATKQYLSSGVSPSVDEIDEKGVGDELQEDSGAAQVEGGEQGGEQSEQSEQGGEQSEQSGQKDDSEAESENGVDENEKKDD